MISASSISARPERGGLSFSRALSPIIIALALLQTGVLAYHAALTVRFPYDLDYGEGYVLNDAARLAQGLPIYGDIQQFPMVRSPYPPLFPFVWSFLIRLTGPEFWGGRAISAASLVGILVLVALSARRAGVARGTSFGLVALFAASPFVYQWAAYARVDMLGVCLSASAVALATWTRGVRTVVAAALLCGLALLTKQRLIAAPVAIALALVERSRRDAALFGVLLIVPLAIVGTALQLSTHGQFGHHVLAGNAQNPVNFARLIVYSAVFAVLHLPLIAAGLWWSLTSLRSSTSRSPLAIYIPLAVLTILAVGNEGSSVNYFLEPLAALALAAPPAWAAARIRIPRFAPLAVGLQLLMTFHWPNAFGTDYLAVAPHGRTPTSADTALGASVDQRLAQQSGLVLADPAGFLVRSGRPVFAQPIDLRAEQYRGAWDSGPLIQAISEGRFSMVITAYDLWPADVEAAIDREFATPVELRSEDGLVFRVYDESH